MYSYSQRVIAFMAFFVTLMFIFIGITSLTTMMFVGAPEKIELIVKNVTLAKTQKQGYGFPSHKLDVLMDLDADFEKSFNWNTKQIYVSIVFCYKGAGLENEVVIWDRIINRENPKIQLHNIHNKYNIFHPHKSIRTIEAKLGVMWNTIHWMGQVSYNKHSDEVEVSL